MESVIKLIWSLLDPDPDPEEPENSGFMRIWICNTENYHICLPQGVSHTCVDIVFSHLTESKNIFSPIS
jgi:hypothetical protein